MPLVMDQKGWGSNPSTDKQSATAGHLSKPLTLSPPGACIMADPARWPQILNKILNMQSKEFHCAVMDRRQIKFSSSILINGYRDLWVMSENVSGYKKLGGAGVVWEPSNNPQAK